MATNSDVFFRNPCSCGGNNENCFKCGGWGYIDNIGNQHSLSKKNSGIVSVCTTQIVATQKHHIQPKKIPASVKKQKSKNSSEVKKVCLQCGTWVANLELHFNEHHANETPEDARLRAEARKRTLEKIVTQIEGRALTKCPICKSMVRESRLKIHLVKVHNKSPYPEKGKVLNSESKKDISPNAITSPIHISKIKEIDGTKDFYAAYRDHGQFGSHPSHDDYSEESGS